MRHPNQPPVKRSCEACGRGFEVSAGLVRSWKARGVNLGRFCSTSCSGDAQTLPLTKERFEANYIPEPNSGCYLWMGACRKLRGYSQITYSKGKTVLAHRAAYILYRGEIEDDLVVRHLCNNPHCVNPGHLALGTSADNSADMVKSGRSTKGAKHYMTVLTDVAVAQIKSQIFSGCSQATIGRDHGVSYRTINGIKLGQTWRHVPWPKGSGIGPDGVGAWGEVTRIAIAARAAARAVTRLQGE